MRQVLIEFNNKQDLNLVISFAKRLNGNVISINTDQNNKTKSAIALLKKASLDQLFLEDINEIETDFKYSDSEM